MHEYVCTTVFSEPCPILLYGNGSEAFLEGVGHESKPHTLEYLLVFTVTVATKVEST